MCFEAVIGEYMLKIISEDVQVKKGTKREIFIKREIVIQYNQAVKPDIPKEIRVSTLLSQRAVGVAYPVVERSHVTPELFRH